MEYIKFIYIYIYIYTMNNLLFKNFRKIHFIYLLITIIIILLLLKISVEGFIPYLINGTDINNYCTANPSGQYNAPTLISNYQCGNYSPNTILPISHKINFTNLQLKNNLCPLNTTFIPPNYIGNITSQVCINTNGIMSMLTISISSNFFAWYVFDTTAKKNLIAVIQNPTARPTITLSGNLLILNNPLTVFNKAQYVSHLIYKLPNTLTYTNYNPTTIYPLPHTGALKFNGIDTNTITGTRFVQLYNFGYFSFNNEVATNIFPTYSMTIFIVYNTLVPSSSSTIIPTSLISGNNNLFEIKDNLRILNNAPYTVPFNINTDALSNITLYTACIKKEGTNLIWNENIYNNTNKLSYPNTFPNAPSWPSCTSINIGGSPTVGFYGNLGEVIIVPSYLDPTSSELTSPYNMIVINLLNKWNIKPFDNTTAIISPNAYTNLYIDNWIG